MNDDTSGNRSERLQYDKKSYQKAQINDQRKKPVQKDEANFENERDKLNNKENE